jgi:hypothetical protein
MKGIFAGAILALVILVAGGCEGTAGSGENSGAGPKPVAGEGTSTGLTGPGAADEYGPDAQRKMDAAFRAFKSDSPEWPKLRQEWIMLGRRATATLVESLYRVMLLSAAGNFSEGLERSRKELILLGELAVPTLAGVLEKGTIYSPEQKRDLPMSTDIVGITAEVIAMSGSFGVPYLAELTESDRPTIRRSAAAGLGQTGSRSAVAPLSDLLAGGPEWSDRMVAARALGGLEYPESEAALVRALEDPDAEVVEVAARSLAQQRAQGALAALDGRRQRAQDAGQHQISAACGAAAKAIRSGR